MDSAPQILASGTTTIYTASSNVYITRLSIVNYSASTSTVNLFKVTTGATSVAIIPKDCSLTAGSALIIVDGIALKTGQSLSVSTTQVTHVDININ